MSTIDEFAYASPRDRDDRPEARLSLRATALVWIGLSLAGWTVIGGLIAPLVVWLT